MSVKEIIGKLVGYLEKGFKHIEGQQHGSWHSTDKRFACILGTIVDGIADKPMGLCSCGGSQTDVGLNFINVYFPELFQAKADPHCPECGMHIKDMEIRGDAISESFRAPLPMVAMHLNDTHERTYAEIVDKLKGMLEAQTGEKVDVEMEERIRKLVLTKVREREKVR